MLSFSLPAFLRLLRVGLHLLHGATQAALFVHPAKPELRERLKRNWSRGLLDLLDIRIDAGDGSLTLNESCLLVSNHISFIDIFVINALLPSSFVAKSDVAKWPLIGWLCQRTGTVFIERGNRKAAHRTCRQMSQALGAGQRFAIFPEGTSTAGDRLLPFHGALFESAIAAAVPVHAIALSYHRSDGIRSEAPAYIDDISLLDCLVSVIKAGGLVVRVTLAASFDAPLPERRHLARDAHQAIAAALLRMQGPEALSLNPQVASP